MMRVTPLRFTTLQCSQIGFTLVRTFTGAPDGTKKRTNGTQTGTIETHDPTRKIPGQTLRVTEIVSRSKGASWGVSTRRTPRTHETTPEPPTPPPPGASPRGGRPPPSPSGRPRRTARP